MPRLDRTDARFAAEVRQELAKLMADSRVVDQPDLAVLTYYQRLVVLYFRMISRSKGPTGLYPARGLLVFHDMGAGKSILGAALCQTQIQDDPHRPPIFMSPRSLHANFRAEFEKYMQMMRDFNKKDGGKKEPPHQVKFVSLDAPNAAVQLRRAALGDDIYLEALSTAPELDGRLLVVDEAQNLFRSIINGSKNAMLLYQQIMSARDLRVIFLSGTPIAKNPFEAVACFNMLAGYQGTGGVGRLPLFPEEYEEFERHFVRKSGEDDERLQNIWAFQNRIYGLVSRISRADIQAQVEAKLALPELLPWVVERVVMDPPQYAAYVAARAYEDDEQLQKRGRSFKVRPLTIPQGPSSSYRVRTRQLSNFAPPRGLLPPIKKLDKFEKDIDKDIDTEKDKKPTDEVQSEETPIDAPEEPTREGSLSRDELIYRIKPDDLSSPKFEKIFSNFERFPGPHLVYSQFRGLGGTGIFARFLEHKGMRPLRLDRESQDKNQKQPRIYSSINGQVKLEDRDKIVKRARAGDIDVLLITLTGARGLNLPGFRTIHHMEPFWVMEVPNQVDGRAVRPGALQNLPPDQRTVHHIMYLSVPAPGAAVQASTDLDLWEGARSKQRAVEEMTRAIESVSLECMVMPRPGCRVCQSESGILFLPRRSLREEIKRGDGCQLLEIRQEEARPLAEMVKKYPEDVPPGVMIQTGPLRVFAPLEDGPNPEYAEIEKEDELYQLVKKLLKSN